MKYTLDKYLIEKQSDVYTALVRLNEVSAAGLTLFVVDSDRRLLGAVTDGDIRRALIGGAGLSDSVLEIMNVNPMSLKCADEDKVRKYREIRRKKIHAVPVVDEEDRVVEVLNTAEKRSIIPVDAVLMAGGKGVRLRPLTDNCPKPLLKVGDRAIIDYNVENLSASGVKNIAVTVNYLKEQIVEHFEQMVGGVKVRCVEESCFLGTIGAVKIVDGLENEFVLVMNSDVFSNIDFEDFFLYFKDNDADMAVAAVPYSVSIPYGILTVDGSYITGIQEKPVYNYYANAGIYLIKRKLLDLIPDGKYFDATDFMAELIKRGKKVVRFPISGYWLDIGKKEEYDKACDLARHLK